MNNDQRSGHDRRAESVTHEQILAKVVDHDDTIAAISEDVATIKLQIEPLVTGVASLVWVGRAIVALGAVALALSGFIILWGQVNG